MAVARAWIAAAALAGCGSQDPTTVVTPIVDMPVAADVDATPTGFDTIRLSVHRDGNSDELEAHSFARGEDLDFPGVPFGEDLVIQMEGLVGTSAALVAYGRTCAITVGPSGAPPSPHLFFSRTVKFATVDLTPDERRDGLGVSFLGGAVFAGGVGTTTSATSGAVDAPVLELERYDPATNTRLALPIGDHRSGAMAVLGTSPPQVVVLGGEATDDAKLVQFLDGNAVNSIEFDSAARGELTATSLVDGRVLVVGGSLNSLPADPKTGRPPPSNEIDEISLVLTVNKLPTSLVTARSMHSATRFGNDVGAPVLIVGGLGPDGTPIASAELFKPLSDSLADATMFNPQLKIPRYRHLAMLLPDESVLIIGGLDANGAPVHTMERFTLDAGFQTVADLPGDAGVIDAVATPLPDGRILLTGGHETADKDASPLATAYIIRFDPNNGAIDVIGTDHLAVARAGHQAALLCDGTVLISGGTQGTQPAERYNPPPDGR